MRDKSTLSVFAVLTGDLIDSTSLDTNGRELARDLLVSSIDSLNSWLPSSKIVYGEPEIFRGDQWQTLLAQPKFAFRSAVYVRAKLIAMGFDSRISIGVGEVDRISRQRVSMSDGDAFVRSGRGLDEMQRPNLAIAVPPDLSNIGPWLQAIVELSDAILLGWTKRQAEVVAIAIHLAGLNQIEIGTRLNTSPQAISKSLKSARWDALNFAIKTFERFDWE